MRLVRVTIIAAALLSGAAAAVPPPAATVDAAKLAKAQHLVKILNVDRMMAAMSKSMTAQMQDSITAAASAADGGAARRADPNFDERMKRVAAVITDEVQRQMRDSMATVVAGSAEIYAAQFTDAELDGMLQFYDSPIGRSVMEKLPAVLGDPRMRAMQADLTRALTARLPDIMAKAKAAADSLPPPPAPPAPQASTHIGG